MSQPNPDHNPTKDKPAVREPDRSPEERRRREPVILKSPSAPEEIGGDVHGDGRGGLTIAPKLPTDAGKPRKSGAI